MIMNDDTYHETTIALIWACGFVVGSIITSAILLYYFVGAY